MSQMNTFASEVILALPRLSSSVSITIATSFASILLAAVFGFAIGLALTYGSIFLRLPGRAYVDFIRGAPILVLILACFYTLPLIGLNISAAFAGIIALAIFGSAHMAEITRGALSSVPRGQTEAAMSIGLTPLRILLFVLLPQAARQGLPSFINLAVEIIKASTLLALIGVGELFLTTQQIVARNYMGLQFYIMLGLIYCSVNTLISVGGEKLEQHLSKGIQGGRQ